VVDSPEELRNRHTVLADRLAALLEQNKAALTRLAASYTRSRSDRDDLLQDIAMALWLALPRFREECSERTFLFRIAHNRCITFSVRRRGTEPLDDEARDLPDPAPAVELQVSEAQQSLRLMQSIRQLPMPYHQVVVLALEGMDYREIAEVLGITESNVGARLNRARTMLTELLGESP